jgi:TonB family protein
MDAIAENGCRSYGACHSPVNTRLDSLQIPIFATWLTLVVASVIGMLWKPVLHEIVPLRHRDFSIQLSDVEIGVEAANGDESADAAVTPAPDIKSLPELPTPPELPKIATMSPLPDLPALTPPTRGQTPSSEVAVVSPPRSTGSGEKPTSVGRRESAVSKPSATDRLAGGSMPAPRYPQEARRRGQFGTVVVEFTVDASGRVISAVAKDASPWPLLNQEALRTVRGWKFPPGGVMTLQRPIVFQLR